MNGPQPGATSPGSTAPGPVSVWNIANALTILRILLVPVYGVLLMRDDGQGSRWAAAAVFAVAMLTDRLDGHLARSRGLVTNFGKLSDPIADKALTGVAFVLLSALGEIWWWVTVAVLVREWGVTALRLALIKVEVLPAGRGGKAKTALQAVALVMLSAPLTGPAHAVAVAVMALAVLVTLITGVDYVRRLIPMLLTRSARTSR